MAKKSSSSTATVPLGSRKIETILKAWGTVMLYPGNYFQERRTDLQSQRNLSDFETAQNCNRKLEQVFFLKMWEKSTTDSFIGWI